MIPKGKIHTFIFTQKPPWLSRSKPLKWINKAIKISFLVGQMDANLNLVIVLLGVSRAIE